MKRPPRHQLTALVVSLLFHAAIVVMLTVLWLKYNPADSFERVWPPVDSSEILLGGEYVLIGDEPTAANEPAAAPREEATSPEPAEPTASTEAVTESPAKVNPSPEKPSKPAPDPAAERRAKEDEKTRQQTASRVSGAFSNSKTTPGNPQGNSDKTTNTEGAPGVDVGGRTLASWVKARGNATGTITIDVTVNREGRVTAASYNPGRSKGAVAASNDARQSCINAARQCRFSKTTDGPETQRGTISFSFK